MTFTPLQEPIGPGRFVLVVGPSGGGKDTIIAGAKAACAGDPTIMFPRRIVTRAASAAEDHDTLDEAAFDQAVRDGGFAFWWQAHSLRYGILHGVNDDIRGGRTVICNVSRSIVPNARDRYADVSVVLVTAPPEILEARLSSRSRSSDGPLKERIKRNDAFQDFKSDYVVENIGAPDKAIQRFLEIIYLARQTKPD